MPYIVVTVSNKTPIQIKLEDLICGPVDLSRFFEQPKKKNFTETRTYYRERDKVPFKILNSVDFIEITDKLVAFVEEHKDLYDVKNRHDLYHTFKIPKKSGGLRTINAPNEDLKAALRQLKTIFERDCRALYHNCAYAYISGRATLDNIKKHQRNDSYWFLKTDFSDFFGSTTKEFILKQLSLIFPFNFILETERGRTALEKCIDLCMLDGGLPQGTPISPTLTNIVMIPIDAQLNKSLSKDNYVYTRYADDIIISCKHDFLHEKMVQRIDACLESFGAPFKIKPTKTHYGSRCGQNWGLGVMLNKDNKITIGWRNTQRFNAMCNSFILDMKNGIAWQPEDINHFNGLISYYKMVEEDKIKDIINHYNTKYNVNMMKMIREALRG